MAGIMTPEHPRWNEFCDQLEKLLGRWGCSGDGLSRRLLIEMGCNVEASLAFFRDNGGYCDCEVLLNVDDLLH